MRFSARVLFPMEGSDPVELFLGNVLSTYLLRISETNYYDVTRTCMSPELQEQGSHSHGLTKFPDFPRLFEANFPWLLHVVVYIQMKQFEDNVSPSTRLKIRREYGGKLDFGHTWKYAERSEAKKIPAADMFSLIRKIWKLYVWPASQQNSLTSPDH